jgi:acyl-CoA thioester hydrolase
MARFVFPLQVRFADTDAQGHVYFANYLTFCDEALSAYMRHIGCPWPELVDEGVDMFYRSSRCEHLGSATFEMTLGIETRIARIGNSSVVSTYVVRDPEGRTIAEAELTSVCVDPTTRRPTRVPDRLREAVAAASGLRPAPGDPADPARRPIHR